MGGVREQSGVELVGRASEQSGMELVGWLVGGVSGQEREWAGCHTPNVSELHVT